MGTLSLMHEVQATNSQGWRVQASRVAPTSGLLKAALASRPTGPCHPPTGCGLSKTGWSRTWAACGLVVTSSQPPVPVRTLLVESSSVCTQHPARLRRCLLGTAVFPSTSWRRQTLVLSRARHLAPLASGPAPPGQLRGEPPKSLSRSKGRAAGHLVATAPVTARPHGPRAILFPPFSPLGWGSAARPSRTRVGPTSTVAGCRQKV